MQVKSCWMLWMLLGSLAVLPIQSAQAQKVSIQATLILASNKQAPADRSISRYVPTLNRMFKFSHYAKAGGGSSSISMPGKGSFGLGQGYRMEVDASAAGGGKIRAQVRWLKGSRAVINTTVVLQPGVPTIFGGPRHGDGTMIVALTAR